MSKEYPQTCNLEALEKMLHIKQSRISQLVTSKVLSREAKDKYNIYDCASAYIEMLHKNKTHSSVSTDEDEVTGDDYHRHRARLYKARADAAELEAAQLRGDLHASTAVEDVWIDMIASARAKLLSTPTRIAASIQGVTDIGEIKHKVEEAIFEALNELTEYDPARVTLQPISQNQSEVETASETDS